MDTHPAELEVSVSLVADDLADPLLDNLLVPQSGNHSEHRRKKKERN